jgi:hypothetical protein
VPSGCDISRSIEADVKLCCPVHSFLTTLGRQQFAIDRFLPLFILSWSHIVYPNVIKRSFSRCSVHRSCHRKPRQMQAFCMIPVPVLGAAIKGILCKVWKLKIHLKFRPISN